MKDDVSNKQPLPPATGEKRDARAAPLLPETPSSMPVASPPASRAARQGRVPRWLLATLVGILVLAGGTGLLISLVQRPANLAPPSSAFQTTFCPFKLAADVVVGKDVVCGYLTVPEDHSRPQGPTIRLAVAIIKASYSVPASDPVVDLQGGPGTQLLTYLGPVLTPTNLSNLQFGDRDLILLDQRGVGYSQPSLGC